MIDPVNGSAHPTEYRYDAAGHLDVYIAPDGTRTHYMYDARGFPTTSIAADGTSDSMIDRYEHDGLGNVTRHRDRNGNATSYSYDAAGRLVAVTNALHQQTRYTWTSFGELASVTDAKQQQTRFAYDPLGRLIRKTWPDQSAEHYSYTVVTDAATGNIYDQVLHQLTDGNTNTYAFDSQGRPVKTTYFDGRTSQYDYTATGQLQMVRDPEDSVCYRHDAHHRVVEVVHLGAQPGDDCTRSSGSRSIAYAYDGNGNRTSMTTRVGTTTTTISYAYDAANRLCSISTAAIPTPCGVTNPMTFAYGYDDQAGTQTLTYPNGLVMTATYDSFQNLKQLTQTRGSQVVASYTYTVDAVGNRTRLDEADGSVTTWEYDAAYRLLHERRQGGNPSESWDIRYTYDPVGNRMTMTELQDGVQAMTSYSYQPNGLDQLDHVTLPDGTVLPYRYDLRGNLLSDGIAAYTYDAADRLQSVRRNGVEQHNHYDSEGRRIRQNVNGVTTDYLWDDQSAFGDVIAEIGADDTITTRYVVGKSKVLAQINGTRVDYLLPDGQGSTRTLINNNATEHYRYTAFGTLRGGSATPETPYLYTGQHFDAETGLYALRARYYQPEHGRFLSRDTVQPELTNTQELNRYGYVANNPVNLIDPTGHTAMVDYGANNKDEEQRAKDHEAYIHGYVRSRGPDTFALFQQAVFSMVVDKLIVEGIRINLPGPVREHLTIGLGTIIALETGHLFKIFSVSSDNWLDAGDALGFDWVRAYTAHLPRGGITIVSLLQYDGSGNPWEEWFSRTTRPNHSG